MRFPEYYEKEIKAFPEDWLSYFLEYSKLRDFIRINIHPNSVDLLRSNPSGFSFSWSPSIPDGSDNQGSAVERGLQKDVSPQTQGETFEATFSKRLSSLSLEVPEFIKQLDSNIQVVSNWYKKIAKEIIALSEQLFDQANLDTGNEKKDQVSSEGKVFEFSEDLDNVSLSEAVLSKLILIEEFLIINFVAIFKILKRFDKHSGLKVRGPYVARLTNLFGPTSAKLVQLRASLSKHLNLPDYAQLQNSESKSLLRNRSANQIYVKNIIDGSLSDIKSPDSIAISQIMSEDAPQDISNVLPVSLKTNDHHVAVSLRGPHGTDIIGSVLECCSKYNCKLLDFSLSRYHHDVVFGVFISVPGELISFYNLLVQKARRWDGELSFDVKSSNLQLKQIADGREYRLEEAPYLNRSKFVATVLSQNGLGNDFLNHFVKWLLEKKISVEKMRRLDQSSFLKCIEFILSVPEEISSSDLVQDIIMFSNQYGADIAFQPDNVFRRQKRLVVFDMDSTLIQQEVIDEIARHAGIVEEVSSITELAMQGKIDFKESLARRTSLLKGTPVSVLKEIQKIITFTDGAHELCKSLKAAGFKLAVISGGFIPLAKYVKNELGLDYAFANQLETSIDGMYLTGNTVGPIVDAERKAELLEVIAQAEGVSLNQVVAVGDGANDLKMLARASLGIAFNAKIKVQEQARVRINQASLLNVLYLMGYSEQEALQLQSID
ncbi:hypothetical protein BB560_001092 [Smittium megazygosporum]|uniref:phosphoserine phosphatase n=1 Tax=Smittium megazygosporum TaxID=133381 RepID=A0A2T9ZIK5_9FUNG|nr:hypothetical protein BB560_001092 [Smittium megazygosporum]